MANDFKKYPYQDYNAFNLDYLLEKTNTAETAMLSAENANSIAREAQRTANTAQDTAEGIADTAQEALESAVQANVTATAAQTTATAAQTTANAAQTSASNAVTTANAAQATADGIAGTAQEALTTAGSAQTAANNAVTTANAAQTTVDNILDQVETNTEDIASINATLSQKLNGIVSIVSYQASTVTFIVPSYYRGFIVVLDSTSGKNGMFALYATGSGIVGYKTFSSPDDLTIDNSTNNRLTLTAGSGTRRVVVFNVGGSLSVS